MTEQQKNNFINKSIKTHGDLYDYSKVEYVNAKTKVCIIDPVYGEFWQTPDAHSRGQNHPSRGRKIRDGSVSISTQEFINKARKIHGNLYDYSKVEYINTSTKIIIIDPEFGEFKQVPTSHLAGHGSPLRSAHLSSVSMTSNTDDFIKKAKMVHGNLYDYSKVNYKDSRTKVIIIDPIYGEFLQTPGSHLTGRGNTHRAGCGKMTTESFIERSNEIHNNFYDYSKVVYKSMHESVIIVDPEFGEFEQTPSNHLAGKGNFNRAVRYRSNLLRDTCDDFIKKATMVHENFYDYSKVVYTNCDTPVIIIDPEFGEFKQTPYNHLKGQGNPCRVGQNQIFSYIHIIMDGDVPVALKYGIESVQGTRVKSQNRKSIFEIHHYKSFRFENSEDCKSAEKECKNVLGMGIMTKDEIPDGYTETTGTENMNIIFEIYKKFGAVEL